MPWGVAVMAARMQQGFCSAHMHQKTLHGLMNVYSRLPTRTAHCPNAKRMQLWFDMLHAKPLCICGHLPGSPSPWDEGQFIRAGCCIFR